MWGDALAREDDRVRLVEQQQQQQQQQPQRQFNQYSSLSQTRFHQTQPPLPPSFQPPPPPPTQQPQQQQHQPNQSFRYGDNDYDDDQGDEDVGAMSTAVNIFASTASTIFSRGGAAAKQLAAQGQKAASQLAAAAAPPPIHPPFTSQANTHQPHRQTQSQSRSHLVVPETSMLETPETHHKPPSATMRISPSLQVPILAPQTQLIDQPTRHSRMVADSTQGFPQQNIRQRPPSPAEAFFGAESPALAQQRNVHYAPPPSPQPHPPIPELSSNQPPATSTMVSSHSFEPPMRGSPATTAPMEHVSGPTPIAAQFFAASAPVPVARGPCIEHIDSTPVLTNQQPPVTSHMALPPPQPLPRSDSSGIAPQFFPVEASVPVSQPPPPMVKTQPRVDLQSNAPSQPQVVQANVLQPALIAVSAPASSAFPPPRPNPVSRSTPPSSPMSATSLRTLNFPVPRRTPVVLPRPKLPSPRTSPGGSSKIGIFKLPTPAKKLPLPRPIIQRPTPVVSEEFDVSPALRREHAYQETKHEAKATSNMQGAAKEATKTVPLLASGIEHEEAHAVREESPAHTLGSEAISVPSHGVQELEILPELPSVPSQPWSASPPVATNYLRIDHAEVAELHNPRLDAQDEPSTAMSKDVRDVAPVGHTEALPEGWIEQHDPNTDCNEQVNASTADASWEMPTLHDPALVAEVRAASFVGGDDAGHSIKACLLPPLERGDEPPGEIVPEGGQSDLDMDVADPGELKQDGASSKEETRRLDPTTEIFSYDNASSGEASRNGRVYNVSASVPDAGGNTLMEGLNRRHELGTSDDARLESTGSSVVDVLPLGADPPNDDSLPEGWSSQQDPATGNIYFYNSLTLETTWDRPVRNDIARNEVENLGRIDVVDQPSGPPEDSISVAAGKSEADVGESVDVNDQPPLSEDWTEIADPTTGITYYYNPTTEETSWIKPVTRSQHPKGDDDPHLVSARDSECPSEVEMLASDVEVDEEETDSQSEESLEASDERAEERTLLSEAFAISEPQSSTELPVEGPRSKGTVSDAPSGDHPYGSSSTKDVSLGMRSVESSESARPVREITDVCEVRSEAGLVGTPVSENMEPDGTTLPQGWTELLDPTSGQPYFFCSLTNETTWERPSSGVGLEEPLQWNAAESEKDSLALDKNETPYVLNADTAVLGDSPRNDPETEIAEDLSNQLPSGWASGVDPSSGVTFYFNGETGETSWDTPVDMSLAEGVILPVATDLAATACEAETTEEYTSKDGLEAEPESTAPNLLPTETVEVGEESARRVEGSGDLHENLEQEIVPKDIVQSSTLFIELSTSLSGVPPAERVHLDEQDSAPAFGENNVLADEQRYTMGQISDNLITPDTRSLQDGDMVKPVLPNPWIEEIDANSGQSYFFNPETLESSWDRPGGGVIEEHNDHGDSSCAEDYGIVEDSSEDVVLDGSKNDIVVKPDGDGALDSTAVLKPSDWTELVDPASGRVYYCRAVTGETSWERPHEDGFVAQTEGPLDLTVSDEQVPIDGFVRPKDTLVHEICIEEHQVIENARGPDNAIASERLPFDGFVPSAASLVGDCAEFIEESQGVTIAAHEKPSLPINTSTMAFDTDVQNDRVGDENPELQIEVLDEPVLPLDWVASVDPTTGNRFYFNVVTSESTWDHPFTIRNDVTSENPEVMPSSDLQFSEEVELAPSECHESEGRGFEKHAHFRETDSETEPYAIPVSEGDTLEGLVDLPEIPETGLEPIEMRGPDPGASGTQVYPSLDTDVIQSVDSETILPEGWVEVVDPASGLPYYFCEATNETSWERPILKPSVARLILGHGVSEPPIGDVQYGKPQDHGETSSEGRGYEKHAHFRETESEQEPSAMPVSDGVTLEGLVDLPEVPEKGLEPIEMRGPDPGASGTQVYPSLDTDVFQSVDSEAILPEGWVEVVDPASGLPYYFCEATNETSWEKPFVKPSAARFILGHGVSEPPIDEVKNGETQDLGETSSASLVLPPGWVASVDPTTGDPYYFNVERNITLWEVPLEEEPGLDLTSENVLTRGPTPDDVSASCEDGDASSGLHDGWVEVDKFPSKEPFYPSVIKGIAPSERLAHSSVETPSATLVQVNSKCESTAVEDSPCYVEGAAINETAGDAGAVVNAEGELLEGWVDLVDIPSGKHYYFNEASGSTTWKRPVRMPRSLDLLTSKTTPLNFEPVASHGSLPPLPKGWIAVEDPNSGGTYYVNEVDNRTTWERPQTVVGSMAVQVTNKQAGLKDGSPHAFASFGFGGRLCVFRASSRPRMVEMHCVCDLVPTHPVNVAEKTKRRFGIVGALNDADSTAVESYIEANAIERTSDFLWSLIQIASRSDGRLRSDEGVTDVSSPESSIIQLLLQAESSHNDSCDRYHSTPGNDVASNRASLHSIESLLLHGKREEAVQEAIASRQFAMALLIASMCDRSTFQHATKQFAEEIASIGSPLYTLALLFSGQLEPPPDSALEMSGLVPTVWSDSTEELRQTWKQHLCAIVSNRILGWDRIVLSLGDRLLELGDVHAAHCCYMVCGCPVASFVHPSSRISLVGCDHLVPLDAALMTDAGIAAFCRSEAYEWAKRRGNPEAVINSLQGFKLAYAMILADLGYNEEALKYVKSIRRCMGLGSGSNDDCLLKKSAPTVWELADASGLHRFINEFDERLSFQKRPHGVGSQPEALVSLENAPTKSIITMSANSADASLSFLSTTSHGLDGEEPVHTTQRSATERTTTIDARRTTNRHRLDVSKPALVGSRSLKDPPAPFSSTAISPTGLFPSTIKSSSSGMHVASFRPGSAADDPPAMFSGSKDPQQPETIDAWVGDETIAARPANAEGPPKVAVTLLALHDSRAQIKVGVDESTGIAPATVLRDPVSTPAPSLPPNKALESRSPQKPKNLVKAPSSAPAELQRAAKTSGREPTSAQKRAWGLGGLRDQMTKWLNPNATTADLGGGMEAYYDEDKKVWVFPGEDPAALAAPIGPPPMATTPALEVKKEEANNEAPPDPLAAMMAPPPRSLSSLRRQPVAPLLAAGLPTGMMLPPGAHSTGAPTTPAAGPPKFMVFTPKAGQTQEEGNE